MPTDPTHDEVGELIRSVAAEVRAPATLRAEVEAMRAPRPRRVWRPAFALGASAAAALAIVLVLVLGGSSGAGPSLADAATAALRPVASAPPAPSPWAPSLLETTIDGISFPSWDRAFGLRATGWRRDDLHGRRAVTVAYAAPGGGRVGYTIVAQPALDVASSARRVTRDATSFAILRRDGATVVTWRRSGHTCVLASRSFDARRLVELAAWTGSGSVGGYNP